MPFFRSVGRVFAYLTVCTCLAIAQSNLPSIQTDSAAALYRLLKTPVPRPPAFLPPSLAAASFNCSVAPLDSIEEPDASVDTSGLTQAMASALARLRQMVASIGGRLEVKSAYRPPAYQEHLQLVWDRWKALKRNRQKDCQSLRAQVAGEFRLHHLLETQRPVSNSDHTRGVGIDASLVLPRGARWHRRRTSLDRLAKLVGLKRPDIRHDPVHFRLLAATLPSAGFAATP